jgi:hypothetical protein
VVDAVSLYHCAPEAIVPMDLKPVMH